MYLDFSHKRLDCLQENSGTLVRYGSFFEPLLDSGETRVEFRGVDNWPWYDRQLSAMQAADEIVLLLCLDNLLELQAEPNVENDERSAILFIISISQTHTP